VLVRVRVAAVVCRRWQAGLSTLRPVDAVPRLERPLGTCRNQTAAATQTTPCPPAGDVMTTTDQREYRVAFVTTSGAWDVVETFTAANDDLANSYAERQYPDTDWFVLDAGGRNVNGGCDG